MNLPVIFAKIGTIAKNAASGSGLFLKAHAPEILVGGGLVGFGVTVVGACKATNKARDILDDKDAALEENDNDLDLGLMTKQEHEDNIRQINRNTKKLLIKTYLPTATGLAVSVILVLGGYRMINGRLVKTAAAYKLLEDGFGRYRENVRDEFGEETDWRMLNNVRPERLEAANAEREGSGKRRTMTSAGRLTRKSTARYSTSTATGGGGAGRRIRYSATYGRSSGKPTTCCGSGNISS